MKYLIFACALWFSTAALAQGPVIKNPRSGFVHEGVWFRSIEEWRGSRQHTNMVMMHEIDEKLEAVDRITDQIASAPDARLLKRYNKNRTTFDINHLTKDYENGAKATMGWKHLHQYALKATP